jgi:phosphoenolpyruvate-protein kinase (PTS system EI component)
MKTLPVATFDGKVILKGVAHGTLFFYKEKPSPLNDQDRLVIDAQEEIDRYKRAIAVTKKELFILAKRLEEANEVESAEIFSAHLMFLDDSLR